MLLNAVECLPFVVFFQRVLKFVLAHRLIFRFVVDQPDQPDNILSFVGVCLE